MRRSRRISRRKIGVPVIEYVMIFMQFQFQIPMNSALFSAISASLRFAEIFSLESSAGESIFPLPLPGRSQFPRKRGLRKVRTPQGNAPHENGGREPRGTRTESATGNIPPMARKGTGKDEMVG